MGLKDKLNDKINKTLSSTSDEFFRSRRRGPYEEPIKREKAKKVVGSKPCVACGAPVSIDSPACDYCTTVNAYYVDPNANVHKEPKTIAKVNRSVIQEKQVEKQVVREIYIQDNATIRCPYCNSPMAVKKKRSAAKHTVAALATGGLSLATLAIPNKKYKCATCGKTFKH